MASPSASPVVYRWARSRRYFGRRDGAPPSHLLLDGGVMSVPDDAAGEFLHEYAKGVVRGTRHAPPPCVVEVRTPVFRMFYDLDARVSDADAAAAVARGDVPPAVDVVLRTLVAATADAFVPRTDTTTAVVCVADAPVPARDGAGTHKVGVHVTFDDLYATPAVARFVREKVLAALQDVPNPFANAYADVVDEAVYKGSGMRLPWSAKKRGDARVYVPVGVWTAADGRVETLDPSHVTSSVARCRDALRRVSLRCPDRLAPSELADELPAGYDPVPSAGASVSHASLADFAAVLPAVEAAIASAHEGYVGRVTGALRGEHAVIFRHSSRYCANVGRLHRTSNTYFVLTRDGLRQRCYSRKATDGEDTCCEHFRGPSIPLPADAIDAALPPAGRPAQAAPMPSSCRKVCMFDVVARAAPPPARRRRVR